MTWLNHFYSTSVAVPLSLLSLAAIALLSSRKRGHQIILALTVSIVASLRHPLPPEDDSAELPTDGDARRLDNDGSSIESGADDPTAVAAPHDRTESLSSTRSP